MLTCWSFVRFLYGVWWGLQGVATRVPPTTTCPSDEGNVTFECPSSRVFSSAGLQHWLMCDMNEHAYMDWHLKENKVQYVQLAIIGPTTPADRSSTLPFAHDKNPYLSTSPKTCKVELISDGFSNVEKCSDILNMFREMRPGLHFKEPCSDTLQRGILTRSIVPMIATASASKWPLDI